MTATIRGIIIIMVMSLACVCAFEGKAHGTAGEMAADSLRRRVAADPKDVESLRQLGLLSLKMVDEKTASECGERLLELGRDARNSKGETAAIYGNTNQYVGDTLGLPYARQCYEYAKDSDGHYLHYTSSWGAGREVTVTVVDEMGEPLPGAFVTAYTGADDKPTWKVNPAFHDEGAADRAQACLDPKLTLIDFWASWCRPCRAEIPNLKKAYELYHDKGFDILSVSIDDEDEAWRKALA